MFTYIVLIFDQALELHLVELEAGNILLTSQLFGKEDIHSMDKMTIMSTDRKSVV